MEDGSQKRTNLADSFRLYRHFLLVNLFFIIASFIVSLIILIAVYGPLWTGNWEGNVQMNEILNIGLVFLLFLLGIMIFNHMIFIPKKFTGQLTDNQKIQLSVGSVVLIVLILVSVFFLLNATLFSVLASAALSVLLSAGLINLIVVFAVQKQSF